MCRERVELENLKWEYARVSEEAKKEKVPVHFEHFRQNINTKK